MNERTALAAVEQHFGSLDEFFVQMLEDHPECLDESLPLAKRADIINLPPAVFSRILSLPQFRAMIRAELVNKAYGIQHEATHFEQMSKVARNERRLVATAKGDLVYVDQLPGDMIAAGKYLNEARGTPVEPRAGGFGGITINIGNVESSAPVRLELGEEVLDVQARPHQPKRAGDLPPPGAQARSGASARSLEGAVPGADAPMGALYGPTAEDEDEEAGIRAKGEAGAAARREEGVKHGRPRPTATAHGDSYAQRAARWAGFPARRPQPDAKPGSGGSSD